MSPLFLCLHRAATVVSISAGETKTFKFKPIKGRYVNIFLRGIKHLTLCEVEVFGGKALCDSEKTDRIC